MADLDTFFTALPWQRFTKASGLKIRSFLVDGEFVLTFCNRPLDRWGVLIFSCLGSGIAEKVRMSYIVFAVADYTTFCEILVLLYGQFKLEGSYRASLRNRRQVCAESIAACTARTTDLCSHAILIFWRKINYRSLWTISLLASQMYCHASFCCEIEPSDFQVERNNSNRANIRSSTPVGLRVFDNCCCHELCRHVVIERLYALRCKLRICRVVH